jgi:methionyl-tRNA formyltransferase
MLQDDHFEIVGVVTQPDRPAGRNMQLQKSPVKKIAETHGIALLQVEKIGSPEDLTTLQSWSAECAVVVAFGQILPRRVLALFPQRIVNVHASLLPRWRGAAPIQRAIMAGDSETGVALQVMVPKLDAGDILGTRKIEIGALTALELLEALKPLAADLLHLELMDYVRGNLAPKPQDETQVTLAPKIDKTEGLIDWQCSASQIWRNVRGLTMAAGAWTLRRQSRLKIISCQPLHEVLAQRRQPGEVMQINAEGFLVTCGSGILKIATVQPESKAVMTATEFTRGYGLQEGEILG